MYAQKLGKVPPLYKHIQEGPAHAPRFNAEVTIDGQTFGRPELLYYKLKDAEAAVAEVALDLLPPIPPQESTVSPFLSFLFFSFLFFSFQSMVIFSFQSTFISI